MNVEISVFIVAMWNWGRATSERYVLHVWPKQFVVALHTHQIQCLAVFVFKLQRRSFSCIFSNQISAQEIFWTSANNNMDMFNECLNS
jgi:hypothetical protein